MKESDVLLNNDEIDNAYGQNLCADGDVEAVARTQLKKVVEWGELYCIHDNGGQSTKAWACPICRVDLKKIAGVE